MSKINLFKLYQQLHEKLEKGRDPNEIYEEAKKYCKGCKTPSPTTCTEQCYLQKLKTELKERAGVKISISYRKKGWIVEKPHGRIAPTVKFLFTHAITAVEEPPSV